MKERLSRLTSSPWFHWGERLLTLGLLAFVAWRLWPQVSAWTGISPSGDSAPAYAVVTLDGDSLASGSLRGKVVVVNFWATWCPPCRLEMPALQDLHEEHADEGLVVLGLSIDAGGAEMVRAFLLEHGYTYPVAMADGDARRAFGGLSGVPTTFILDRDGTVRHRVFGFFAPPAMKSAVRRLLAKEWAADSSPGDEGPPLSAGRGAVR